MTESQPLAGVTVVVTRPVKQAGGLCRLIEAQGGEAIRFPALEILPCDQTKQLEELLGRLETFDLAIFVSSNAVEGAAQLIGTALPDRLQLAAVGNSTRATVEQQWQRPAFCPANGANSEALLAMPELQQVNGRRIVIFRGRGGRELLAETLVQRGAAVEYAEVYRRARPAGDLAGLMAHRPAVDLITATSNETLQNLHEMAADDEQLDWLCAQQLVVISARGAELAAKLGFAQPAIIAARSGDAGLVSAVLEWRAQHH
jgi:uroporphyrinogen-III synthase